MSLESASSSKENLIDLQAARLDRKQFSEVMHEYLDTKDFSFPACMVEVLKWCNILGFCFRPAWSNVLN